MEGDLMKMREALVLCSRIIGANGIRGNVFLDDIQESHKAITDALAAPPRQCDVGTAEEQSERFMDFCRPGNRPPNCEECKVYPKRMNKFWCQLEWAQMPYEA